MGQWRDNCSLNLKRRRLVGDPSNLLVLLVNLQGAAVIFRVGWHHHRGPFCEGRGLTHALTDTAPTDLTVATHSPLGAQPQSDRILRLPCGRLAPAAPYTFALDTLKRACRSSSLQASRSARSALSIGLPLPGVCFLTR